MTDQIDASARPPDPRTRAKRSSAFVAGIVAAFLAIALYSALFPGPRPLTETDIQQGVDQALASETPPPAFSELVYADVAPSLVTIQTTGVNAQGKADTGLGSGVVVDAAGDILTALHVVTGANTIKITFADGTTATGTVSVREPDHDIAVVQPSILSANVVPATQPGPARIDPGRCRDQPGQFRGTIAQPKRPGDRDRDRPGQPRPGRVHRDRTGRADRCRWRSRRPAPVLNEEKETG